MLLPISTATTAQYNVVFSGVTDSTDLIIYSEELSDNSILTLKKNGEIDLQTLSNGVLNSLWSVDIDKTLFNGKLDSAQELLAVSYDVGFLVFSMSTQTVAYQINLTYTPDDLDWDSEGNVWLAYYDGTGGSSRRAVEYNQFGATGFETASIGAGFLSFQVLSNDLITFSAMDSKTHVYGQDGVLERKLSQSSNYLTYSYEDDYQNFFAGSSDGKLYRYNTTTWSSTSLDLGAEEKISYMSHYNTDTYIVGTEEGSIFIVGASPFIVQDSLSISGKVTGAYREFGGQISVFSSNNVFTDISFFDLDSDLDGSPDSVDIFPTDPTQDSDSDGDGYGDNLSGLNGDAFPYDSTQHIDSDGDGYGDNVLGNDSDAFPQNSEQWLDSDGDGYGDNTNAPGGDSFPAESSQWNDSDGDGYGDNPEGFQPDGCTEINGFSTLDRFGCLDSDFDKYSDPTDNWTISDGADALPNEISQWVDRDGDGYGENNTGVNPDSCPLIAGTSTKTWQADLSSNTGFSETSMYGCLDSDGDNWADTSDAFPDDSTEWFDGDGDGVGSNSDYDDTKTLVSTEQEHCILTIDDFSDTCNGWRDSDYQDYLSRDKAAGEGDLSYPSWVVNSEAGNLDDDSEEGLGETIKEVAVIGGVAFVGIAALVIIISFIAKKRKINSMIKMYGVPFEPEEASANDEALEGSAGLSATGGIESDDSWEDDVEEMNFTETDSTEETETSEIISSEDIYEQDDSLEDIAGIEVSTSEPSTEEVSAMFEDKEEIVSGDKPSNAPPVPASGLPEGWTMDQWEWYGHEWLAKNSDD
jgi:hypothetical protein